MYNIEGYFQSQDSNFCQFVQNKQIRSKDIIFIYNTITKKEDYYLDNRKTKIFIHFWIHRIIRVRVL